MGQIKNSFRIFVEEHEGKTSLGRPRRRWEDNIKTNLRKIGSESTYWNLPAQDIVQRQVL
jgi:hypothetical protein